MPSDENIRKLFEDRFTAYRFPFKSANAEIAKLDNDKKMRYAEDAAGFLRSDLWKIEMAEFYRSLFHELAFKSSTEEERNAYRMTILFLQRWEDRLVTLSKLKSATELDKFLANI